MGNAGSADITLSMVDEAFTSPLEVDEDGIADVAREFAGANCAFCFALRSASSSSMDLNFARSSRGGRRSDMSDLEYRDKTGGEI